MRRNGRDPYFNVTALYNRGINLITFCITVSYTWTNTTRLTQWKPIELEYMRKEKRSPLCRLWTWKQ